ncbi:helix-turn-helix transcriptional regulator [Geoalkalibacter sp.]|uniref:helix-turn-helix transcriptional regulator n=1 Tax=Geoalkalibacter sp. TaxID=3041440 RepID=UPI00272E124F|nr:WYL domain-containing protein [Geoalkalibacter sp.]
MKNHIEHLSLTEHAFSPRPMEQWQSRIQGAFGIFQGEDLQTVTLRFSPHRARWVSRELWHPCQQIQREADGALLMQLVVADFREIKLRILQYGAEVEVLEPAELRAEIRDEIARLASLYEKS